MSETQSVRAVINSRLSKLGWSRYRLVEAVADQISKMHVYDYLAGRKDITGEKLAVLLAALGLEIREKDGWTAPPAE